MSKLTLTDLANLENQNTAIIVVNNNNAAIEAALENTLSRDGTSPNSMSANLDMNSYRILNLPAPVSDAEPLRKIDVPSSDTLNASVVAAEAAAALAASYDTSAGVHDTSAAASATAAQGYASLLGSAVNGAYATWADVAAATIVSATQTILVLRYDTTSKAIVVPFKRVATQPSHDGKIRSTDRFLPNGTTSSSNGGWWELDVDTPTPGMFGAKLDVDLGNSQGTDDTAKVQSCFDYSHARAITIDSVAKACKVKFDTNATIRVDGPVTIPYNIDVFVEAYGATMLCRPGVFGPPGVNPYIFDRMPPDQTTALNTAVQHKLVWKGGTYYGILSWNTDFIRCGATYGSCFQDMFISSFHSALRLEFALKTVIENCFFEKLYGDSASGRGLYLGEGSWTGADASNSQSNRSTVRSCHFGSWTGKTEAALWINQSSGCSVYECIFEGGNPVNNIVYNNTDIYGKDFYVEGIHCENFPTNAHILITTNGGTVTLNRIMPVDGGVSYVVDNTGCVGGIIVVGDIPDPANIGKFRHQTATGGKWWFNSKEFTVQTAARWDTGTAGCSMPDSTHLFQVGMSTAGDFKISGKPDFTDGFKLAGSGFGMTSCFRGTASITLGPLAAGATTSDTVTVTGCGVISNESVIVNFDQDLLGITYAARVTAADTVTVSFTNGTSASHTLGTVTGPVIVTRIA